MERIKKLEKVIYCSTALASLSFLLISIVFFQILNIDNKEEKHECLDLTNTISNITFDKINSQIVADQTYFTVEKDYISEILALDDTNKFEYRLESFDCDEFGFFLMSNMMLLSYNCDYKYRIAFGVLIGYNQEMNINHLINFFIDGNNTTWCVEPQDDTIINCRDSNLLFQNVII